MRAAGWSPAYAGEVRVRAGGRSAAMPARDDFNRRIFIRRGGRVRP